MASFGIELADNQFGFRRGRSTDDVVRLLTEQLESVERLLLGWTSAKPLILSGGGE